MDGTSIRYYILDTIANSLYTLWRSVMRWRDDSAPSLIPTEPQHLNQEIEYLLYQLEQKPSAQGTDHQTLLRLLDEWYATLPEYDEEWWEEFEADLAAHRLQFRLQEECLEDTSLTPRS